MANRELRSSIPSATELMGHMKGAGWSIGHSVTECLMPETKELVQIKEHRGRDNKEGRELRAAEAGCRVARIE